MMNSTNKESLQAMISQLKDRFSVESVTYVQNHEVHVELPNADIHGALTYLKTSGYKQLSALTCIDWLEEGKFQLIFNVFDWSKGDRIVLQTKLDRMDKDGNPPLFNTITSIYNGAKYYEREVHEFFGIVFEGNPDALKQLFLERWDDIPPLRKDFISREYSDRKYIKREYRKSFGQQGGEPFERD